MTRRPTITEEAMDSARRGFITSVQALDRRITEEPLTRIPSEVPA